MWIIKFWYNGSNRFIWVGESKNLNVAQKLARKFADRNCEKWEWVKGNQFLIRGVTKDEPVGILISIAREE